MHVFSCVCVSVTDVVCSRGQSILGCTCILHHKHYSGLRCDSYMCGYSWVPTDQADMLQHSENKMSVLVIFGKTSLYLIITVQNIFFSCHFLLLLHSISSYFHQSYLFYFIVIVFWLFFIILTNQTINLLRQEIISGLTHNENDHYLQSYTISFSFSAWIIISWYSLVYTICTMLNIIVQHLHSLLWVALSPVGTCRYFYIPLHWVT